MPTTFAAEMLEKYETLLKENVGAKSVSVDGQAVSYEDLTKQYDYWRRRVLQEQGKAPRVSRIRLDGF